MTRPTCARASKRRSRASERTAVTTGCGRVSLVVWREIAQGLTGSSSARRVCVCTAGSARPCLKEKQLGNYSSCIVAMRPRRRCRRWEQQENNESRLNGSSVRRRRLRPRVCVRAQQPRLSPQSAAIADEAAVGCSSDARRRDAGDVATERRGVPSTEAPSDMQPASAAAETAAASTSRASAAESREQRRECIGIGIGIGLLCAAATSAPAALPARSQCGRGRSAFSSVEKQRGRVAACRGGAGVCLHVHRAHSRRCGRWAQPQRAGAVAEDARQQVGREKLRRGHGAESRQRAVRCYPVSGRPRPSLARAFRAQRNTAPRSRAKAALTLAANHGSREACAAGQMHARVARGALRRLCSRLAARSDALPCAAVHAP